MKPIQITEKFKPFSKSPGVSVPFPLLGIVFVIYPAKIKVVDWKANQKTLMTFEFKFKSPCKKFVVHTDLLKNTICVQSHLEDNFAQWTLSFNEKKRHFTMTLDRYKEEFLSFEVKRPHKMNSIRRRMSFKRPLVIFKDIDVNAPKSLEVLFLGCHKKQEIEKVFARKDLREFLPLWFLWGQYCPMKLSKSQKEGAFMFLSDIESKIEKKEHQEITPFLNKIMSSSFAPMMVPYLEDFKHWGFHLPKLTSSRTSPWLLLKELYVLTRRFFILSKKHDLYFLPHLPPQLHCGKMIRLKEGALTIHLEWSKKLMKKMIVYAYKSTTQTLHFQNDIRAFRLRTSLSDRGKKHENHCEISFKKGKTYFFDRFEK